MVCISGSPSYAKRIEFPILHRIASQPNPIGPIGSDCAPAIGSKQRVREREREEEIECWNVVVVVVVMVVVYVCVCASNWVA